MQLPAFQFLAPQTSMSSQPSSVKLRSRSESPSGSGRPPAKKSKMTIRQCVCGCTKPFAKDLALDQARFFRIPPDGHGDPENTNYALLDCLLTELVGSAWKTSLTKPQLRNVYAIRDGVSGKRQANGKRQVAGG